MPQIIQVNGTADSAAIRIETFQGREYTVVPVIGLVEGLLQGLNASEPEFASANEFAKFPMGWNGRPVTMNHPRDAEGNLSSANIPILLEEYSFGFLANSQRDGDRLKFEAWLDNAAVSEKGGEFQETLDRLNSGEDIIEVSTGLFCEVVQQKGIFNGRKYNLSWSNVVPDHLAMLSAGSTGACSVEDGCGAPRLNQQLRVHTAGSGDGKERTTQITTVMPINLGAPTTPTSSACCESCAKGGTCTGAETKTNEANQSESEETMSANRQTGSSTQTPEGGQENVSNEPSSNQNNLNESAEGQSQEVDVIADSLETNERYAETLSRLAANSIDPSIAVENARDLVQSALRRDLFPNSYAYVLVMTTDQVAFEIWSDGEGYQSFAVEYSVDGNGGVTFTGEPVPVNLLVRIVPRDVGGLNTNEGASGANQQQEGNATMAGENQTGANQTAETTSTEAGKTQTKTQTTESAGGEVNANASGAGASSAPRTLQDFLNDAPPEVAEVVREGIELRTQKRAKLVSSIVANSNNAYTEDMLQDSKRYPLDELERLNVLCAPRSDFSGRPFPTGQAEGLNTNSENQRSVPAAPKAFEGKKIGRGRTVNDSAESN